MRGVFVDANESLAVIFERLQKPGDPEVRINRDPDISPEQYPEILDDAEIAIVDHTALPTDIAKKCAALKHVVFLGTGARSYMNPDELAETGIHVHLIKGYGDTAVAECAIAAAIMWPVVGKGADRLAPYRLAMPALLSMALGMLWFSFLPSTYEGGLDYLVVLPGIVLFGLGVGTAFPAG